MRRLALLSLSALLSAAACGSSGSPASPTGSGGAVGSGGTSPGTGGQSPTGTGGQATTGTGGAAPATGGAGGSDSDGGGSDASDGNSADTGGGCPAGAIICEDFEKYATGATDLSPTWVTYKYGGATLQVDTTKAWKGTKALHMTTPTGGRKYADIIKQNPLPQELLPIKHYGRVMVWVTALPTAAHWNINQASGPLAANAMLISKYSFGGQNSVLSPNYTQRPPIGDNLTPLRGGGPEDGDPTTIPYDCGPNAQNQKLSVGKWVCWEWMFDSAGNKIQLFLDGVEQTQAGVTGRAGDGCGNWQGPKQFTKMIIGWEQYTQPSDKPQDAWLDDLVVAPTRIGCPTM